MRPKTHIYPHCYTPYEVLINMYPRKIGKKRDSTAVLLVFTRSRALGLDFPFDTPSSKSNA